MSPAFSWNMPVDLRYGVDCIDDMPAALQGRQAVVLAMPAAETLGWRARWSAAWGPALRQWVTVADGLSSIARARELADQVWPHLDAPQDEPVVIVAIGGGTTLDLAKVLRCRPVDGRFDGVAAAIRGQRPWPALQRAPLWLVPTTAGTGSEVTRWATVWDTGDDDGRDTEAGGTGATPSRKLSLDEPWGYAERAWVDPRLALSCPPAVTRDTALDTLAHALESVWNCHANPVSTRLAVGAARQVLAHLPGLLAHPDDLALRSHLSLAALQAGMAFSQTRTALAHALSYDLTLHQGIPHGLACALWLPVAWRLALGRDAATDAALAEVFGVDAADGVVHLQAWLDRLGIHTSPQALAARGIHDADARVQAALHSPRGRNFIGAP